MKHRFHVLALPHTVTSKEFLSCAYTQKVLKFTQMMKERGHTIYLYAHESSNADCHELIPVTNDQVLRDTYGEYDWKTAQFKHHVTDNAQKVFNQNAIRELETRKQPGDFLLCFWGFGHEDVAKAHPDLIAVEPGIGYPTGLFAPYKVFESYSIRDIAYEKMGWGHPQWYDAIIPNYFDPADFEYREKKDDYFLYLGRLVESKGIHVAVQASQKAGVKLKIAGQGDYRATFGDPPDNVELVGFADVEKRKSLLAGARALYVPTYYVEPFGGVMVEALFSGTPVITTDWGAFAENNLHGITGYRCRLMEHFVWATQNIHNIDPKACRQWAMDNFSTDVVALMYEEYFDGIVRTRGPLGWYEPHPGRENLDWMTRKYPIVNK
jgi:glycosyltransferase involved in cell wall biosynthesis